ncbi:MAG: glycosyltransferase family 39 protein [Planctomycetes bacterium]|nr:glycosyltransferase family 39 protein [Planctomycetota bacterium]
MKEIRRESPPEAAETASENLSRAASVRFAALSLAVVALGLIVRLLFIGRYEVWLDEAYCFGVAAKPIRAIIADLALDNGPPLYYFLLHYWMALFGEGPVALRSLSAVFSAGTVAVVVFWKTPWFSRRARLLAGFVLAITPLAVYYAQETRMYSPVLFFTAVGTVFLEKGLRRGGRGNWALFGLFTLLGLYTSYIAIFLVPLGYIVAVAGYCFERNRGLLLRRLAGLLAAHLAVVLLFLPWLPTFVSQPSAEATGWIARLPDQPNKVLLPVQSLSVMTVGGAYYPTYLRHLWMSPQKAAAVREAVRQGREKRLSARILARIPPVVPLYLVAVLTVAVLGAALGQGETPFPRRVFLVCWLALPILVPLALSLVRPMYVVGRYELTALPALAGLSGLGLAGFRKAVRIPALVLASLLFLYTWGHMQSFGNTGLEPARGAYVARIARPGDIVLTEAFEYAPTYYYAGSRRDTLKLMTFPRDTKDHSAWIDYDKWLSGPLGAETPRQALLDEAAATVKEAVDAIPAGGRIIVVRPVSPKPPQWVTAMESALYEALDAATPRPLYRDVSAETPGSRVVIYRKLP